MRTQRFFKQLPATKGSHQVDVLHIRILCDGIGCDHSIEYEGTEKYAEAKISLYGWSKGSTGIVRCGDCSKQRSFILERAFGRF